MSIEIECVGLIHIFNWYIHEMVQVRPKNERASILLCYIIALIFDKVDRNESLFSHLPFFKTNVFENNRYKNRIDLNGDKIALFIVLTFKKKTQLSGILYSITWYFLYRFSTHQLNDCTEFCNKFQFKPWPWLHRNIVSKNKCTRILNFLPNCFSTWSIWIQ